MSQMAAYLACLLLAASNDPPRILDDRLQISLFAAEPDVVTPVGIACDRRGRTYVLESHTHSRSGSYKGPRSDRVKIFIDDDRDGRPERIEVFADGLDRALNIDFSPDGTLYVGAIHSVLALHDADGDGRSEARTEVLRVKTGCRNPHGCLLGLAFSPDGWLHVARGWGGGSPYVFTGSDGSTVSGFGDGGNIVRCRPDGSRLEEVATGFWNPMGIDFDTAGRLLCVDNDPDSRGPNRLLHIVPGGDYGFRARFGPSGLHPHVAWNGELPGTLPMIAGVGEAPSDVIDAGRAALPADYAGNILVTVWGTHTISRFRTRPAGASIVADGEPWVRGDDAFRPVAMAAAPDGTLYVTDWVQRNYPVHGRGRIWRIAPRKGVAAAVRVTKSSAPVRMDLGSDDPFARHAAVRALGQTRAVALVGARDPVRRLGAAQALRRLRPEKPAQYIRDLLADPEPDVRITALLWAAEAMDLSVTDDLPKVLTAGPVSPRLLRVYLATAALLTPGEAKAYAARKRGAGSKRSASPGHLGAILANDAYPAILRATALTLVDEPDRQEFRDALLAFARGGEPSLRFEAIRTLALSRGKESGAVLRETAGDVALPSDLRAEAVLGLARRHEDLTAFLKDPDPAVRREASRTVRKAPEPDPARPKTEAAWLTALAKGGDADSGRRLFFHPALDCVKCHRAGGRGGRVGPDLTNVAQSKTRGEIILSVLRPSREIAPQYQGYKLLTKKGEIVLGTQFHYRGDKNASMVLLDGREKRYRLSDLKRWEPSDVSLMPDGLADRMSTTDFRDLVAYLSSLK